MKDAGTKYGFLSIYQETIFLRQDLVNGQWCLFVRDIVSHNAKSEPNHATLRQCFWYIMSRPVTVYHVKNDTPMSQRVQNSYWLFWFVQVSWIQQVPTCRHSAGTAIFLISQHPSPACPGNSYSWRFTSTLWHTNSMEGNRVRTCVKLSWSSPLRWTMPCSRHSMKRERDGTISQVHTVDTVPELQDWRGTSSCRCWWRKEMQGWWFMRFPITTERSAFGFLFRPLSCHPGMLHLHLSNHYECISYF